jgi:cbb3-type cytochrome oxidase subunit 3
MVEAISLFGWTFIILIFITVLYSMISGGK